MNSFSAVTVNGAFVTISALRGRAVAVRELRVADVVGCQRVGPRCQLGGIRGHAAYQGRAAQHGRPVHEVHRPGRRPAACPGRGHSGFQRLDRAVGDRARRNSQHGGGRLLHSGRSRDGQVAGVIGEFVIAGRGRKRGVTGRDRVNAGPTGDTRSVLKPGSAGNHHVFLRVGGDEAGDRVVRGEVVVRGGRARGDG